MDISRDQSQNVTMKTIPAAKFKAQCLALIDEVDEEGIVITKRGKPVAKLVPIEPQIHPMELFGSCPDLVVDPNDDLLSTGDAWDAEVPAMHRERRIAEAGPARDEEARD